ncbi:MAG: ABC transporter ATP-binding protein [Erysipelotrichaceae bacterium]|jgi:ATP-binding cassette subfamily B multidrug efflux pump|nr:ABC transporter ATP-binding protein [Erysipelotrichaceae bacterium]
MSKEKTAHPMNRPGHGPMGAGHSIVKAKDFSGTMKKLLRFMKPYYAVISIALIFASASTVLAILGPKILGNATTELAEGFMRTVMGTGGIDFDYILRIILTLLGIYLISSLMQYIMSVMMATITQKTAYGLRKDISEKINRMPLKYFDTRSHGDVLSRVTNDVDTLQASLSQSLSQIVTSMVQVIGYPIMMLTISWQMTLMSVCVIPLSLLFVSLIVKKSQVYFKKQQSYLSEVNGHVEEMYSGHVVMKAFNGEERSIEQFKTHNDHLYETAWKSQFLSGLMMPITQFVGNLGYVGVCLLGGWLASAGTITIGDIQAFIQYVRSFNQPISQLAQVMNMLQSTAAAAERVFEFLEEEEELSETSHPKPIMGEDGSDLIKGTVTFENVHFGYHPDKIVIHDFSMYINAGKRVAIVGPTGAGKTTIVKLLMRFYELNSGTIYVDGIDIKDFRRKDLRSLFGMVLQDAWLFNGTVMENLRYGRLDATDEEVKAAADAAYVDHFIRTLDHGYDTILNEESSNISQGQKQLLTIARAFLADPKILILDEATSSVDTRTEVLIQKGMEKLMENRTCFVIAHRLSTIRDADLILVMKDGDIVEVGDHKELMERNGFYTSLYNSQFEEV